MAIFEFLAARPWIVVLVVAGFAVWIAALWIVVRSPKFLRKWLWVLLSLLTFTFRWGVGHGITLGVGIPLGALYILWFARFGANPTPEALAARAAKTKAPSLDAARLRALRIAYCSAAITVVAFMAWMALGPLALLMNRLGAPRSLRGLSGLSGAITALLFGGVFMFLAVRPYWWGKLFCWFAALAWIGHGLIAALLLNGPLSTVGVAPLTYAAGPVAAGLAMLAIGLFHQRIDPRFGGTYLQAA